MSLCLILLKNQQLKVMFRFAACLFPFSLSLFLCFCLFLCLFFRLSPSQPPPSLFYCIRLQISRWFMCPTFLPILKLGCKTAWIRSRSPIFSLSLSLFSTFVFDISHLSVNFLIQWCWSSASGTLVVVPVAVHLLHYYSLVVIQSKDGNIQL